VWVLVHTVYKPELSYTRLTHIDRTLLAHTSKSAVLHDAATHKDVFLNQAESYPACKWGLVTWWSVKDPLAKHAKF
jgi:hypothetical protein